MLGAITGDTIGSTYEFDNTKDYSYFQGVFYWEPEAEHARNGYDYEHAFRCGIPDRQVPQDGLHRPFVPFIYLI